MTDYFKLATAQATLHRDIQSRLDLGENPNAILPTVVAHYEGTREMVAYLLTSGGDVEAKGQNAMTLVHLAIVTGKPDVLELLIERGADLGHKDSLGNSYIDWAGSASAPLDTMAGSLDSERPYFSFEADRVERRGKVLSVLTKALTKLGLPTTPTNRFKATMHWPK